MQKVPADIALRMQGQEEGKTKGTHMNHNEKAALTHRATTADEQATHLTDEGHQAAIASFMATPGFKEALAELAADQQGDTASARFADWLAREMPAGTVISDPAWWAPRILRAAQHGAAQAQAGDVARDAARYRWLRNSASWGSSVYEAISEGTREDIDAAIDRAAMAAPATSGGGNG